jgi:uroporphyrin-3 C-methyltransferase
MTIQRAIDRDLEAVKSAQITDLPRMLLVLDVLVAMADELPLAIDNNRPSFNASQAVENAAAGIPVNAPWWKQVIERVMVEARGLLRVSRIDAPEAALLSPDQAFFLRENLKLKLLNARLGLLARQSESLQADMSASAALVRKYFDMNSRKVQQALKLIEQSQAQVRKGEMPRMDGTLSALATAAAGR